MAARNEGGIGLPGIADLAGLSLHGGLRGSLGAWADQVLARSILVATVGPANHVVSHVLIVDLWVLSVILVLSHLLVHWILRVVYLVVLVLRGSGGTLSSVRLLHVVKVLLVWLVLHILGFKLEGVVRFYACHLLVIPAHRECLSVILPIDA